MTQGHQDGIRWSVVDGIGRIVLAQPEKANAIGLPESIALSGAIHEVLNARPRAVLLTGTGRIFCAGGDIAAMSSAGGQRPALIHRILTPLHPAMLRLSTEPVPVLVAINGAVGGAGVGLALCGDTVISTASMKMRTGYAAIGLSPDAGASYFLARRAGSERARQMFLYSEPVDAQRCLALGIVDAVHPDDEFAAATEAQLQRMAALAPCSVANIKRLFDGMSARALSEHLSLEEELLVMASSTRDAEEGLGAFIAKRAPRFEGR